MKRKLNKPEKPLLYNIEGGIFTVKKNNTKSLTRYPGKVHVNGEYEYQRDWIVQNW